MYGVQVRRRCQLVPEGDIPCARVRGPRWSVLALAQFMVVLDVTIVNVALPDMQAELGFSPDNLQWVISAYTLAFGGFLLLGGRLGDVLGRRGVFAAGLALFTAASLAGGPRLVAGVPGRGPRRAGLRRRADVGRRPVHPHRHVRRRARAQRRDGHLGRAGRARRHPRRGRRRRAGRRRSAGSGSSSSTCRSASPCWPSRRRRSPTAGSSPTARAPSTSPAPPSAPARCSP